MQYYMLCGNMFESLQTCESPLLGCSLANPSREPAEQEGDLLRIKLS